MLRAIGFLTVLTAVAGGSLYTHRLVGQLQHESPADSVSHRSKAPTIHQVRELAKLVTLDVPISDLHVSEMSGYTGSVRMAVAVRGDVQFATDLQQARYASVDQEERSAVLILPKPVPDRARIDHEKTRILEIDRDGLWRVFPGSAGESTLTNRAMADAQRVLTKAAEEPHLTQRACARTEKVVRGFFDTLGWSVHIQWEASDDPAATAAATGPDAQPATP